MKNLHLFFNTKRELAKSEVKDDSNIVDILTKAGYIAKVASGVYTYLPLGFKVINNITRIIRQNMDTVATEVLMPCLSPVDMWKTTGRIDTFDVLFSVKGGNEVSFRNHDTEYVLNPTHEELVTPLIRDTVSSYKDLPLAVYQIQTKFRNEVRAKSGIARTREFLMKDMYSFHTEESDLNAYFEQVATLYTKTFKDLGLHQDVYKTYASGGSFCNDFSVEYQLLLPSGEDTVLVFENGVAINKEIDNQATRHKLNLKGTPKEYKCSEVGNIFKLGTKYSSAFNFTVAGKNNTQIPVLMGCYGIGVSRLFGVLAEYFADEKGLCWPMEIAPFQVEILVFRDSQKKSADQTKDKLEKAGVSCLIDDRDVSPGVKFADADLIGCPVQVRMGEDGEEVIYRSKNCTSKKTIIKVLNR